MASSLESVETAALKLSPEERAQLAQQLLSSLPRDREVQEAWDVEIQRRIEELDAGRMCTTPAEQVFSEARRRLDG